MRETKFKSTLKAELRSLQSLLEQSKIDVKNTKVLSNAFVDRRGVRQNGGWCYSFENLVFENICLGRHIRPQNLDPECADISLKLAIQVSGIYQEKRELCDPLQSLGINFVIKGEYLQKNTNVLKQVICSWHLDKGGEEEESEYIHPEYHFNFGGSAMTRQNLDYDQDFGNLLLLEIPRIAHPPMDAILAVDFILHNFYTKAKHQHLTGEKAYQKLIKQSQSRFWKPYFTGIAQYWDNAEKKNQTLAKCFQPYLI